MLSEEALRLIANEIRCRLADLGKRLKSGADDTLLVWVIPNELACAHRPLRHHPIFGGSGRDLPTKGTPELERWTEQIIACGIRSVLCLMHPKEIRHYRMLALGASDILEFYRKRGLIVCHIPWEDPAHRSPASKDPFKEELSHVRRKALAAIRELPKPVVMHCSAGIDRSAPVAAYLFHHFRECM